MMKWTAREQLERTLILGSLQKARGHMPKAAKLTGFGLSTLYYKIKLYNLKPVIEECRKKAA